ncbi:Phosphoserine phosphatase RsbP [Baekduia alba]|nr:Phosphoserine phosphatase RsbP [Baekduia alba]
MDGAEAEDLFEHAPCGYVVATRDGTIVRVNHTLAALLGQPAAALVGRRFQELLTVGGQIYHETHYAPLLAMQGRVREIAVDLVGGDGSTIPALITSTVRGDEVRTIIFEAVDRRRYEQELVRARDREHAIAGELQRALLGGAAPRNPAIDLGVSYRPAVAGLEVGGDWYDAFWLSERRLGLVVGDVVGRGIGAATTMGQLRSAVRALASTGLGASALLDALDGYARRHDVGQMTTLAYAELDVLDGSLTFACAGHPPPAVAAPGASAVFAWDGRSPPLDAAFAPEPRPEAPLALTPGALVVLFTDGLFERVDRPLKAGLDRLLEEIDAHRALPAGELADAVTRAALAGRRSNDDACLLAVRWTPPADAP